MTLEDYFRQINQKPNTVDFIKNSPWYRKQQAKIYETTKASLMMQMQLSCHQEGTLLSESDGQFTGNVWSEVYEHNGVIYEFMYEKDKLIRMIEYDLKLYKGGVNG